MKIFHTSRQFIIDLVPNQVFTRSDYLSQFPKRTVESTVDSYLFYFIKVGYVERIADGLYRRTDKIIDLDLSVKTLKQMSTRTGYRPPSAGKVFGRAFPILLFLFFSCNRVTTPYYKGVVHDSYTIQRYPGYVYEDSSCNKANTVTTEDGSMDVYLEVQKYERKIGSYWYIQTEDTFYISDTTYYPIPEPWIEYNPYDITEGIYFNYNYYFHPSPKGKLPRLYSSDGYSIWINDWLDSDSIINYIIVNQPKFYWFFGGNDEPLGGLEDIYIY